MVQLNTSPVYNDTILSLREVKKGFLVYQNDELITLINAPIMKIVRAIRSMFPNANMQLI